MSLCVFCTTMSVHCTSCCHSTSPLPEIKRPHGSAQWQSNNIISTNSLIMRAEPLEYCIHMQRIRPSCVLSSQRSHSFLLSISCCIGLYNFLSLFGLSNRSPFFKMGNSDLLPEATNIPLPSISGGPPDSRGSGEGGLEASTLGVHRYISETERQGRRHTLEKYLEQLDKATKPKAKQSIRVRAGFFKDKLVRKLKKIGRFILFG